MHGIELPPTYVIAEGPEGLREVLDQFLESAKTDSEFAAVGHYILYQLGDQKSLIKVDMSATPYQFYYYDYLGRPATKAVKKTIVRFLWEKCGEREKYLKENES